MDYPSPFNPNPAQDPPPSANNGPSWSAPQPPVNPAPAAPPVPSGPSFGAPLGSPPAAPPTLLPNPGSPVPGTPTPGPAGSHELPTPAKSARRWPVLLLGLVLGGLFTATGFWLGQQQSDEPQVATGGSGAIVQADTEDTGTLGSQDDDNSSQPAASAPPALVEGDVEEPVAAVARVLAPSVVGVSNQLGEGSGVAYTESRLITNAHVVGDFTDVQILLEDGRVFDGTVLGTDESRDVAVVELDEAVLTPATFAPSSSVEVGQIAIAVGSPFGLEQTVTAGIVSAVDRVVENDLSGEVKLVAMVQTDAPINPGNSGGALADRQGRVIGMNTSIRTAGGVNASVGIGFAVPSDTMLLIAERIVAGESLETGFLGVMLRDSVVDPVGALVTDVNPDSAAEGAGIEIDDIIVEVGGRPVDGTFALAAAIQIRNPGETVEIVVSRGGELVTLQAELGSS